MVVRSKVYVPVSMGVLPVYSEGDSVVNPVHQDVQKCNSFLRFYFPCELDGWVLLIKVLMEFI